MNAGERSSQRPRNLALLCCAAAAAALVAALAYPALRGRLYVDSDLLRFHVPVRFFYARALEAGHSFAWFPYEFLGFYVHGEGQAALYHPWNLILYSTLPFVTAFTVELVGSYVLLLAGVYLLLRRWPLAAHGALFGAFVFAFSSFNLLHFMHPNVVATAAHLPWLLFAVDVLVRSPRADHRVAAGLGVALLTASQLLNNHPQIVWMSLLAELCYAGFLVVRERRADRLLPLAAGKALGILLAAVQLLPMLESFLSSTRTDPTDEFITKHSLHAVDLAQLLSPYLFENRTAGPNLTETGLYLGAVVPPLLLWACLRRARLGPSWPFARASLVAGALALVLAMGDRGLLFLLQKELPLIGLFRAPARYLLLAELAFAIVAGIAVSDLARFERSRAPWRPTYWLAFASLPAASLAVAVIGLTSTRVPGVEAAAFAAERLVLLGPTLSLVATALVVGAARGARSALIGILLFAAADQAYYALSHISQTPQRTLREILDEPEARVAASEDYRLSTIRFEWSMVGVRSPWGYVAMWPTRKLLNVELAGASQEAKEAVLRIAAVGWDDDMQPLPGRLPRARLVSRAQESRDLRSDIAEIDVATTALVSERVRLEPDSPGTAQILEERPGEIAIRVESPSRQLLVLSEAFHPGWHAHANGETVNILRVYGDLMGCVVEAGATTLRFRFEPWSLRVGKRVSMLAGVAALAWGAAWVVLVRRSERGARGPRGRGAAR